MQRVVSISAASRPNDYSPIDHLDRHAGPLYTVEAMVRDEAAVVAADS